MSDRERDATRWLRAANEDLAYARHAANGGYHAPCCFHSQQAAEKALKAIHYARGARVVIGHSVRRLIENLTPPEESLTTQLDAARELDLLYVPSRYPNGLEEGSPGEAFGPAQSTRALRHATEIVTTATRILGEPA